MINSTNVINYKNYIKNNLTAVSNRPYMTAVRNLTAVYVQTNVTDVNNNLMAVYNRPYMTAVRII